MKTVHLFSIFFRNLFALLFIALISPINLSGQTNKQNTPPVIKVNATGNINAIKEKADQTYLYAEQSNKASTLTEAKTSARHALVLLEEIKQTIINTQTTFAPLLTTDCNKKCGKLLNSISGDLIDMQNKTSWATHKVNKIISTNEYAEIKPAAAEVMSEIKKMESLITETISNIVLVDTELNRTE